MPGRQPHVFCISDFRLSVFTRSKQVSVVRLLLALTAVGVLQGCSSWPGPDHRNVTMDRIEAVVARYQPSIELSCPDIETVSEQVAASNQELKTMSVRLAELEQQSQQQECATPDDGSQANRWQDKLVVGETEWIYLSPPGHHYRARIDSGATTSSLSAQDVERFERNGDPWVRFKLQHDDEAEPVEIERPLERNVLIRQSSSEEIDRRAVVKMTINIGPDLQQETEFTLADRSHMTYPMLLGRSFLRDVTLIDVGKQFLNEKYQPENTVVAELKQSADNANVAVPAAAVATTGNKQ